MIANKWMKWAVAGALALAFPAIAVAHTHKTTHLTAATATKLHAKRLSTLKHHKAHTLSTRKHTTTKLHATHHKARSLSGRSHKAAKLASKKRAAISM